MAGDERARGDLEAEVCVIGAGAAGLWAGAVAARAGRRVLLLEKTVRTGTKVLASGGTKCNLTTTLRGPDAAALFGQRGERFLRRAFAALPPEEVRARFEAWGCATIEAPLEKIFPASGRAIEVRDALEREARSAGVAIATECAVVDLEARDGGWRVALRDGRSVHASRVIVCPGGASYPKTGTTGDGYAWLARLGCAIVEPIPALVPLRSDDQGITELTGIALQEVTARLARADGKVLAERRRPVLFTHHGVSGPGALDVSEHVARAVATARAEGAAPPRFRLLLDLLPELAHEGLRELLLATARNAPRTRLGHALPVELPRRLLALVAAQAGLAAEPAAIDLDKAARHRLIESLKAFAVPITGTLGLAKAEVTAGGLALSEVDPGTMAVRGRPGLFACGEILDLQGPIGGLNFQAAFATAELAGRAVAAPG